MFGNFACSQAPIFLAERGVTRDEVPDTWRQELHFERAPVIPHLHFHVILRQQSLPVRVDNLHECGVDLKERDKP
jgi:hypothetical protein